MVVSKFGAGCCRSTAVGQTLSLTDCKSFEVVFSNALGNSRAENVFEIKILALFGIVRRCFYPQCVLSRLLLRSCG